MNRFNYIIYQKNFRDFVFINFFTNQSFSNLCSNRIVLEFNFEYHKSSSFEILGIFFLLCELLTFQKGILVCYSKSNLGVKNVGFKVNLQNKRSFVFFEKFFIYFINQKPIQNFRHVKVNSGGFFLFDFSKDSFFYDFSKKIGQKYTGNDFSVQFRCIFIYQNSCVFKQNVFTKF